VKAAINHKDSRSSTSSSLRVFQQGEYLRVVQPAVYKLGRTTIRRTVKAFEKALEWAIAFPGHHLPA